MLALRRTAADSATWWQRIFAWATRVRLVSDYCHGGIVIDGMLYQVNAAHGLHRTDFDPAKWDLYPVDAATMTLCCCTGSGSTRGMTMWACWPLSRRGGSAAPRGSTASSGAHSAWASPSPTE